MDKIACQMHKGHEADMQREVGLFEYFRQDLAHDLKTPLRPTELLLFEGFDLGGQFRRHNDICKVTDLPTTHLGAIAQVQVLGQSIPLPAACVFNARAPPDAGCTIEIKKKVIF